MGDSIDDYAWSKRPVIVFAASDDDSRARAQIDAFKKSERDITDREIVVIGVWPNRVEGPEVSEIDPREIRRRYGVDEGSFAVLLVGKDTGIKRRSAELVDPTEFFALIDTMPMRRQEMQSGN